MTSTPIATYNVTGIADALTAMGEKRLGLPNVTLVFSTDLNGMVGLKDAYIKMRYEYQEQVPVKKEKATMKLDEESMKTEAAKKKEEEEEKPAAEAGEEKKEEEKPVEAEEEKEEEKPVEKEEKSAAEAEEKKEGEKPAAEAEEEKDEKPVEKEAEAKVEADAEKKKEEEEPVEMITVTKRKIRKVSLRVSSLIDRLVILPLSAEQKRQSVAL